ncbi:uncharacterized protein LOC111629323 [Centruroides sculpturatus]|uniref:uncharacterized protein LOC111629323 n=1 Tax=Centruroides sculpturatus TaxID=218467 RepID=UPI000C6D7B6E|nr:uncharacterized protein LOC111629323 [Centruroides sculpturatus]
MENQNKNQSKQELFKYIKSYIVDEVMKNEIFESIHPEIDDIIKEVLREQLLNSNEDLIIETSNNMNRPSSSSGNYVIKTKHENENLSTENVPSEISENKIMPFRNSMKSDEDKNFNLESDETSSSSSSSTDSSEYSTLDCNDMSSSSPSSTNGSYLSTHSDDTSSLSPSSSDLVSKPSSSRKKETLNSDVKSYRLEADTNTDPMLEVGERGLTRLRRRRKRRSNRRIRRKRRMKLIEKLLKKKGGGYTEAPMINADQLSVSVAPPPPPPVVYPQVVYLKKPGKQDKIIIKPYISENESDRPKKLKSKKSKKSKSLRKGRKSKKSEKKKSKKGRKSKKSEDKQSKKAKSVKSIKLKPRIRVKDVDLPVDAKKTVVEINTLVDPTEWPTTSEHICECPYGNFPFRRFNHVISKDTEIRERIYPGYSVYYRH